MKTVSIQRRARELAAQEREDRWRVRQDLDREVHRQLAEKGIRVTRVGAPARTKMRPGSSACIRFDPTTPDSGPWWVMVDRSRGWNSFGWCYAKFWDLLDEWDLSLGKHFVDQYGDLWTIVERSRPNDDYNRWRDERYRREGR
jgi:hypothetical protein